MSASREDVLASIHANFPSERWEKIASLLDTYGSAPHERERERVQLAILKISAGDERKLEEHVATAKQDYRDVLFWADHPQEAKLSPADRKKVAAALRKLGASLPEE